MRRRNLAWLMAVATLTLLVTISAPAFPADEETTGDVEAPVAAPDGRATVEMILRQQEGVLTGQPFAYEPSGRRDPFRSLYGPSGAGKAERPTGVAGMTVNEVDLAGVVAHPNSGDVAMVIGSDSKGYFLRVGDRIYDATVIAVNEGSGTVTFRQEVDDPRLIKPFRDVTKRLVPLSEESVDE